MGGSMRAEIVFTGGCRIRQRPPGGVALITTCLLVALLATQLLGSSLCFLALHLPLLPFASPCQHRSRTIPSNGASVLEVTRRRPSELDGRDMRALGALAAAPAANSAGQQVRVVATVTWSPCALPAVCGPRPIGAAVCWRRRRWLMGGSDVAVVGQAAAAREAAVRAAAGADAVPAALVLLQ